MIYHRSKPGDGLFLVVCGLGWPGAPERNDYYEHLVATGEATCGGQRPNTVKRCTCKKLPERSKPE
jgi:hypothetical protein